MNEEAIVYKEEDLIKINDIEFIVVDKLFYSGKHYLFLADINSPENYVYVEETESQLIEITDESLTDILAELIIKKHNLQDLTDE